MRSAWQVALVALLFWIDFPSSSATPPKHQSVHQLITSANALEEGIFFWETEKTKPPPPLLQAQPNKISTSDVIPVIDEPIGLDDDEIDNVVIAPNNDVAEVIGGAEMLFENLVTKALKTSPELPVNLMMSCMSSLSQGTWTEGMSGLEKGGLHDIFLNLEGLLDGTLIKHNPELALESWVWDNFESSQLSRDELQNGLTHGSKTALMLYWGSMMCSSCNEAFKKCEKLGNCPMKSKLANGVEVSDWVSIFKKAVVVSRLSLQELSDKEVNDESQPISVSFDTNMDCMHTQHPDADCIALSKNIIRHKILVLKLLADGNNVCMSPIQPEAPTSPRIDDLFLETNFLMASRLLLSNVERHSRLIRDLKFITTSKRMRKWAVSFVNQRVCPAQNHRWAIYFTQTEDADADGNELSTPVTGQVRLVYNPLSQLLPWDFQAQNPENKEEWGTLCVGDVLLASSTVIDPLTTAVTGLEVWSVSQKQFVNTMMAWLKSITDRKGPLVAHYSVFYEMMKRLDSKNNMIKSESKDESPTLTDRFENVQEAIENATTFSRDSFSSKDNLPWVSSVNTVALGNEFASIGAVVGQSCSLVASLFFLWDALWVDNTYFEKGYSVFEGNLVWADAFVHVALTAVTGGVWLYVASGVALYVTARSMYDSLSHKQWFIDRFGTMSKSEFDAEETARRRQVCFTALYSAVFVAENTARDIANMSPESQIRREALGFDAPASANLKARESIDVLFHDLLFSMIDSVEGHPLHNIVQHSMNPSTTPLRLCGRVVNVSTKYISPSSASWPAHVTGVDETTYRSCRSTYESMYFLFSKRGYRIPCSPSELVLAFYHAVLEDDKRGSINVLDETDRLASLVASPATTMAKTYRASVVDWFLKIRDFQRKLFIDQDLGMMSVWFTLHMLHVQTFRSVSEREVVFQTEFQSSRATLPLGDDPPACTSMDNINHELVHRSGYANVPDCEATQSEKYACGDKVNMCTVVPDPMSSKNWKIV